MSDLETLWHDYHFRIRNYLKKHMRDDWMTDEMLAIVYYRAAVATANGHGAHTNGAAWLFQIARSAMTDHWRYYRDITFVDFDGLVDRADDDMSLEDMAQAAYTSAQVQDAIARLVDSQREVIRARMAGRSFAEIAEERGTNSNTAKQIGVRAFASLRKKLVDLEGNQHLYVAAQWDVLRCFCRYESWQVVEKSSLPGVKVRWEAIYGNN